MIPTDRLRLIPATRAHIEVALESDDALGALLGARVPDTWPPEYIDERALIYTLDRLAEGPEQAGWWLHFVVLEGVPAKLIGTAGYKGPPKDGTVEVGYGIVADHQRRGYATEATRALIAHAFARPAVRRVIAETLPELIPSIGVLEKLGFVRAVEEGSEPGVIRFELERGA